MLDLQADLHSVPTNLEEFSIKFQTALLFYILIIILHIHVVYNFTLICSLRLVYAVLSRGNCSRKFTYFQE